METPKHRRVQAVVGSPFSSKVILIAIGHDRIVFNVHQEKLSKTSFFKEHGIPPTMSQKEEREKTRSSITPSSLESDSTVKPEDERDEDFSDNNQVQDAESLPDYYIVDKFHIPEAFKIFIQWLYNEPPAVPKFRGQCRTLLQTYVLACRYEAYQLQNLILDIFRQYHAQTKVKLDDLVWITNRMGDYINTPMCDYLVDQIAFEIAENGIEDFSKENIFMDRFLEEGTRVIRRHLFNAIARCAKVSQLRSAKLVDPAKGSRDWHVQESGEQAGLPFDTTET